MSTNGYPPTAVTPGFFETLHAEHAPPRHRYWLHALLLLLTLVTTTVVGSELAHSFAQNRVFTVDFSGYQRLLHDPASILDGLPFSMTLLVILLAHEMGHYLAARYYHVDVTLPFFLPAPTLIGTFGAFIRIRSAILAKRILFDIGIGGPIAGFLALILPLIIGVSLSKVEPGIAVRGDVIFGTPLFLRLFEWIAFPGVPASDIYLHPVARAAWVGLLATALNLLPIGQLDGGHIMYAFFGERTKLTSRIFVAALGILGAVQLFTSDYKMGYMWLFWALLLFILGMRHPAIVDPVRLSPKRRWLGLAALLIFILSFTLAPIRTTGL
ncbi:MAG TPA: site-2 protease family protein [Bryobacteraceae bacterium]|nr:site-2 protease family protein [Bryobacteraceae bacterium]